MAQDIDQIFTYHPPDGTQPERYVALREEARQMAHLIVRLCPESRERSLAITNLQQAIMWANSAIAINEDQTPEPTDRERYERVNAELGGVRSEGFRGMAAFEEAARRADAKE